MHWLAHKPRKNIIQTQAQRKDCDKPKSMKHVRWSQTVSYSCICNLRQRDKIKNGAKAICEEIIDDALTKVRKEINLETQEIRDILRRKHKKKNTPRHTKCLAQSNRWDKGYRENVNSSQRGEEKKIWRLTASIFCVLKSAGGWGEDGRVSNLELYIYRIYPLKMNTKIGLISSGPGVKNPLCNAGHTGLIPCPGKSHMPWSN